jgi:hypothetical protein
LAVLTAGYSARAALGRFPSELLDFRLGLQTPCEPEAAPAGQVMYTGFHVAVSLLHEQMTGLVVDAKQGSAVENEMRFVGCLQAHGCLRLQQEEGDELPRWFCGFDAVVGLIGLGSNVR